MTLGGNNMKSSELLHKAKKYLWNGKSRQNNKTQYICHALEDVVNNLKVIPAYRLSYMEKVKDIQREIVSRLEPYDSMLDWLTTKGKVPHSQISNSAMQAHRFAWLDVLIEEYKAKGD
jgi:hypothetical protein